MNIQALALDLDGTLVDTLADLSAAANAMREDLGLAPLDAARIGSFVGGGMANLVHRALTDSPNGVADPAQHATGLEAFKQHYDRLLTEQSRPYQGVREGLANAQAMGLKLAVVTNKPLRFTVPLLTQLGLASAFSLILGGDSLTEKKPSALPLWHVCDQFRIVPAALLMVGDSGYDLDAARAAGAPCVLLDYGYADVHTLQPDAVASSLVEVIEMVKNGRLP